MPRETTDDARLGTSLPLECRDGSTYIHVHVCRKQMYTCMYTITCQPQLISEGRLEHTGTYLPDLIAYIITHTHLIGVHT